MSPLDLELNYLLFESKYVHNKHTYAPNLNFINTRYLNFIKNILQADQRVLRQLIVSYLPKLDESLKEHDIGKIM